MMIKKRRSFRPDLPWSKRWQVPDRQIVGVADQYESACRLLLEQPPGSGVQLPLMNLAVVSIELYLKSLSAERVYTSDAMMPEVSVVTARPSVAGHSLKSLFNAISDEVRVQIIIAYDEQLRFRLENDFLTELESLKGAFETSRYPYEPDKDARRYNRQSLVSIAKFLREFVHTLPPKEFIQQERSPDEQRDIRGPPSQP